MSSINKATKGGGPAGAVGAAIAVIIAYGTDIQEPEVVGAISIISSYFIGAVIAWLAPSNK